MPVCFYGGLWADLLPQTPSSTSTSYIFMNIITKSFGHALKKIVRDGNGRCVECRSVSSKSWGFGEEMSVCLPDFRRTVRTGCCVNVRSENTPFDVSGCEPVTASSQNLPVTAGCFGLGPWLCGAQRAAGCQTLIRGTFTPYHTYYGIHLWVTNSLVSLMQEGEREKGKAKSTITLHLCSLEKGRAMPASLSLSSWNLRELRMETVQLDQHAKEMERRLEELRQHMNQQKEEREKMGASHWRSAQPGVQSVKTNKENAPHRLSPGKMKIRVLKDEPVPAVQEQVIAERAAKVHGTNRKLNLKGKVCGQCEVQLAGLMCAECGEDYCVGCFVRFHQKGALQRHRMVPVQAELQTPVSTRDVLGRFQQQVSGKENQQSASPKSADESEATEKRSAPRILWPISENQIHHTQPQVLFVNDGVDLEDEEAGEEEDSSLLRGGFDEEESARSFQEALKEWRERGQRPVSVMETQTEKGSQPLIYVAFKEDTLSYMEKLLLKKHRRGQIEEFQHRSVVQRRPEPPTPPPTETDELSRKLTAERMELHKYFTSLFMIALAEDAGKADSPAESCLSIVELDEKMAGDATLYRSFGVKQGNESKMFAAVGNEDLSERGDFGYSVLPSTPSFSEMTKGSFSECNSDIKINSSPEMWPPFQEATQSSSSLPRSESFSPLQTRLQRSQHLSATSEPFLLNSQTGGQKVELSDSPKPSPRTRSSSAQQDKPSELLPTSSPSLPKNELNQTLLGFEDHISTVSPSPGRAIHSVAQRQDIQSGQYQDLEGILTLGLDPGVLQPSPAPAQTSREEQNHTGSLLGQESWRSSSSLQHYAEEELVTALMNAQPINSTPCPFTPCRGRMSSQRLCFSGTISRCSPISSRPLSAGTHRPDPSNRPLSRAALEIMEVQTVEQLDLQDSDEDEEDFLALACLEEEFRNMSTTQLDEGEDGHIPVDEICLDCSYTN
ncbi:uncharacterized protein LOC107736004 [Sinocyclocheilus rhinocerous]|uniref:uncharacterized protein LOC107736004 n=1 Tax=Sinocyclocheilus rhinocerous TaxID=307959 RepID=UPI0007B92D53|nr:PREDICTED: uncharacterized protein LOC107736004 [Sinocyclocheilus rhinocerous]